MKRRAEPRASVAVPAGTLCPPPLRELPGRSKRSETVFWDVASACRDIDGMHTDESLDELCKLLCAKAADERATRRPPRFRRTGYANADECAAAIHALYAELLEVTDVPGADVFGEPIRLSNAALAVAVDILEPYRLSAFGADACGRAFEQVLRPAMRAGMGQYFTPEPLVQLLVHAVRPVRGERVLDPFCGSGRFLRCAAEHMVAAPTSGVCAAHGAARTELFGIEKSERMARVLATQRILASRAVERDFGLLCSDALLDLAHFPELAPASFDVVLTNPPFGIQLPRDALASLGAFDLARGLSRISLEALGIERCLTWLRPGGRLGIVLPEGLLTNRASQPVRNWLAARARTIAILGLPAHSFAPFGASIRTSILLARKYRPDERPDPAAPVFLARLDRIGYDAAGRPESGSEVSALQERLDAFQSCGDL